MIADSVAVTVAAAESITISTRTSALLSGALL